MVQISEMRIVLPMTVADFRRAQRFANWKTNEDNTEEGQGGTLLSSVPYYNEIHGEGIFTHSIYRLGNRLPDWVTRLVPASAMVVDEKSWVAFPFMRSILTIPFFSKLKIEVLSLHLDDAGTSENALSLTEDELRVRKIDMVDIAKDKVAPRDYKPELDPALFKSKLTGIGPLAPGWQTRTNPLMCAYKVVRAEASYWGVQSRAERLMVSSIRQIFLLTHRNSFCYWDEWGPLSLDQILEMEREGRVRLRAMVKQAPLEVPRNADVDADAIAALNRHLIEEPALRPGTPEPAAPAVQRRQEEGEEEEEEMEDSEEFFEVAMEWVAQEELSAESSLSDLLSRGTAVLLPTAPPASCPVCQALGKGNESEAASLYCNTCDEFFCRYCFPTMHVTPQLMLHSRRQVTPSSREDTLRIRIAERAALEAMSPVGTPTGTPRSGGQSPVRWRSPTQSPRAISPPIAAHQSPQFYGFDAPPGGRPPADDTPVVGPEQSSAAPESSAALDESEPPPARSASLPQDMDSNPEVASSPPPMSRHHWSKSRGVSDLSASLGATKGLEPAAFGSVDFGGVPGGSLGVPGGVAAAPAVSAEAAKWEKMSSPPLNVGLSARARWPGALQPAGTMPAVELSAKMLRTIVAFYKKIGRASLLTSVSPPGLRSQSLNSLRTGGTAAVVVQADPYGSQKEAPCGEVGPYSKMPQLSFVWPEKEVSWQETEDLIKYRQLAEQVVTVEVKGLSHEERLAFWINIYNALVLHAFLVYGYPRTLYKRVMLMHKASYVAGRQVFSALMIEHSVLRACSYRPNVAGLLPVQKFKASDERSSCILASPEPLVSFALCCGAMSAPALRVYSAGSVQSQLEAAKKEYLQAAIGVGKNSKVLLPKLLHWYDKDFASSTASLLEYIAAAIPNPQRSALLARIPEKRSAASKQLQIVAYCWDFRYLLADGLGA